MEFARRYTRQIEANIEAAYARRLRLEELAGPKGRTWYLPHFLVTNSNKPEKPRLAFDAASKHGGLCLNKRPAAPYQPTRPTAPI
jgi:hypothetical protein